MKTYLYNEGPGGKLDPVEITEDEIIKTYWDWWSNKMKGLGREDKISRENCIADWVTTNWAWEHCGHCCREDCWFCCDDYDEGAWEKK